MSTSVYLSLAYLIFPHLNEFSYGCSLPPEISLNPLIWVWVSLSRF